MLKPFDQEESLKINLFRPFSFPSLCLLTFLLSAYCVRSIVVSSKRDSDRVKSGGDGRSLGIWFHFALTLLLAPILEAGVSSP